MRAKVLDLPSYKVLHLRYPLPPISHTPSQQPSDWCLHLGSNERPLHLNHTAHAPVSAASWITKKPRLAMGQTFHVVAPRAKRYSSCEGKLADLLAGGEAEDLLWLLAVPVRPQHHSPQNSTVIASTSTICEEQREKKRNQDDNNVHGESAQCPKQAKVHTQDKKKGLNTVVGLLSLPSELHRLIFSFVDYIVDVISFSCLNQSFLSIGCEILDTYYMHHFGRWAGKNIVCVGEDVNPNDYPPGLFSKEELEVLRQKTTMIWDDYGDVETQPFTLYHFTYPRVSRRQIVKSDLYHIAGDLDDSCYDRGLRKDPTYEMHIRPYLRATQETYFPTDQLWILRNLTMKQIVRADAIALSPDYINGPDIKFLGFPEVILSRISWSSSQPIGFEEKSVRGVWAGHCFDITTLSKHKTETREEEWTDVSEEVSKEITSDWEAKIGANWREIITRSERW